MSQPSQSELANLQRIVQLLERLVALMEPRMQPSYIDRWASTRHEPASGIGGWVCGACGTKVHGSTLHQCTRGLR